MLSLKQEKAVAQIIQELTDLQIKSKIIESHQSKGLTQTDEQEELQTALESIRARIIELARLLAQMFESKGFDFYADRLEGQGIAPETLQRDLVSIEQVLADVKREAEKRLERNIRRRQALEEAEKRAEQTNEKVRSKQEIQKASVPEFTASKPAITSEESYVRIPINGLGMLQSRFAPYPARLSRFAKRPKEKDKKKKQNLIQVKSSEAKAKDFANQRALKKTERAMTRSAPAMAPSQMSR